MSGTHWYDNNQCYVLPGTNPCNEQDIVVPGSTMCLQDPAFVVPGANDCPCNNTLNLAPTAATNIASPVKTQSSITLTWTAGLFVDYYNVTNTTTSTTIKTTQTNAVFTGLTAATSYSFTITSVNAFGTAVSSPPYVTSTTSAVLVPATPVGLVTTFRNAGSWTGTWTAVANATSYNVQYWIDPAFKSIFSTATNTAQLTNLYLGNTYTIQVSAANAAGSSNFSTPITAYIFAANAGSINSGLINLTGFVGFNDSVIWQTPVPSDFDYTAGANAQFNTPGMGLQINLYGAVTSPQSPGGLYALRLYGTTGKGTVTNPTWTNEWFAYAPNDSSFAWTIGGWQGTKLPFYPIMVQGESLVLHLMIAYALWSFSSGQCRITGNYSQCAFS